MNFALKAFVFAFTVAVGISALAADGKPNIEGGLTCYLPTGGEISPTLVLQPMSANSHSSSARLADPYPQYLKNQTNWEGTKIEISDRLHIDLAGKPGRVVTSNGESLKNNSLFVYISEKNCEREAGEIQTLPFTMFVQGYESAGCCKSTR
jgi:hypothetical protein